MFVKSANIFFIYFDLCLCLFSRFFFWPVHCFYHWLFLYLKVETSNQRHSRRVPEICECGLLHLFIQSPFAVRLDFWAPSVSSLINTKWKSNAKCQSESSQIHLAKMLRIFLFLFLNSYISKCYVLTWSKHSVKSEHSSFLPTTQP